MSVTGSTGQRETERYRAARRRSSFASVGQSRQKTHPPFDLIEGTRRFREVPEPTRKQVVLFDECGL